MRCSNCCEQQGHQSSGVSCPKTGICRPRQTVEQCRLTKAPKLLFIQLIRNVGNQPKLCTPVKFEDELVIPGGHKYEPIATLDHIGNTPTNGHYVTFLKLAPCKWIKFDDKISKICTIKEANTRNNYILLFKMKEETHSHNLDMNQENEKILQPQILSNQSTHYDQEIDFLRKKIKEIEKKDAKKQRRTIGNKRIKTEN